MVAAGLRILIPVASLTIAKHNRFRQEENYFSTDKTCIAHDKSLLETRFLISILHKKLIKILPKFYYISSRDKQIYYKAINSSY